MQWAQRLGIFVSIVRENAMPPPHSHWEFTAQRAFLWRRQTCLWPQTRSAFRIHASRKQIWGRSCFSQTLVHFPSPRPTGQPGDTFPGPEWPTRYGKHAEHGRRTFSSSSLVLGTNTFTIPAWKDMNPSKHASVFLPAGHLGLARMAQAQRVWESGNCWLQGQLGP